MTGTPPSAPEPPRFSDWVEDAYLSEYITNASGDKFTYRVRHHGQHIDSLLSLQRFASTRWPDLAGSYSIKTLWAKWLREIEEPY